MKDKEKQIEELMKDKEFVKLVKLIDNTHPFYVETIALRVYEKYQPKLPDSVVLSRKEYEKNIRYGKSIEDLSEKLNNLNLDLGIENQKLKETLENKSKETAEKILKDLKLLVPDNALGIITRYFKEILSVEIKEN